MIAKPVFDHVHYRTSSFEKTRDFYVGVMEATDLGIARLGKEGHRHDNLQLELGGTMLLFVLDGSPPPPECSSGGLGAYHIALHVADCDAATEYYVDRGAKVAPGLEPFDAGDGIRASFLCAPDGMLLELKQSLDS